MATLTLDGITKSYGVVSVISKLDLAVEDGEFCVLVGPSGCGKSTLLRIIAGLEPITSGRILIDDAEVSRAEPADRGIAMVFQSYALYPHMNVDRNMGFGLEIARTAKAEIASRVGQAARKLRLDSFLQRKPRELSGGQRQRVAIGRAITRRPKLFLLDEPLSNLDAALRVGMRVEIARLKAELGATMIYVTHDQVEAMTLADRIVVMNGGRIEQIGTPLDLYESPANLFVAGFIGSPSMNLLPGLLERRPDGGAQVVLEGGPSFPIVVKEAHSTPVPVTVGIRPEHIRLATGGDINLRGEAAVVEMLGSDTFVYARCGEQMVVVRDKTAGRMHRGDPITLSWDEAKCHLFDEGGRRWILDREAEAPTQNATA
ncbi:ABC transporter ATP-binding protein [Lichenifustis flavocetrariae]|uniref:Sn-glycerol-3-phosphate ABC transporter ATP-binding protein UgpC n=1 Tax=Lichenifustis flavocetrariae TaxID=2949735 RepID=A0AA41YVS2_9HYPH|nr:sn-glycerol-3-phosphate ABC transporter ATP-binding protein UgpC [Lichenifustis flavocetrariae]MCW6509009.1 sn-glycerol-3-phosphate ABC transporter ATP-binding protein UgpC [Lichenifustis flavocetrariae]